MNVPPNSLPVNLYSLALLIAVNVRPTVIAQTIKHENERNMNVMTSNRNCGNKFALGSINWGNSAVVNNIAFGLERATATPWAYNEVTFLR
ncbi:hypothetical protein MARHY3794 [Marinobacter nauticus ATCC 49840]|nr:hypothetical protein MARHY3794 [Marinobacter nauticus ATCC 49840]